MSEETKLCPGCNKEKLLTDFGPYKGKTGGQSRCRICHRLQNKEWHARNLQRNRARATRNRAIAKQRARQLIFDYLLVHPCVDCGEPDLLVLHFDHRDRDLKILEISFMMGRGWSTEKIQEEINKCDVRCANCHMRRTAKQLGYWRYSWAADSAPEPPKFGRSSSTLDQEAV